MSVPKVVPSKKLLARFGFCEELQSMKAIPRKLIESVGYVGCPPDEATHLTLRLPGPTEWITLPVKRAEGGSERGWVWNGSVDSPTLSPSILSRAGDWICHSYVRDGKVEFLPDCSHELAGKTVELLEAD